jgi:SAM-dependent methyltransferase
MCAEHGESERDRLTRLYEGYGQDPGRRSAWAADNPGNVAIRAEVAAHLRAGAGAIVDGDQPVLDAGCGTGYWLDWLVREGVAPERLHGADLIAARVDAAGRRVPGAHVAVADVRALPYPDATFGLVLLFTVLSSQPSRPAMVDALREARRVLAPGGAIVVWDVRRSRAGRATRRVPAAVLRAGLGEGVRLSTVTLLPPLARRLGRATGRLYGPLARVPALRTHWLAVGPG